MRIVVSAILILLPIAGIGQALDSELYVQLKEYSDVNVRPVLKQQRDQLEPSLTDYEKERINDLRAEIRMVIQAANQSDQLISSGLFPSENPIQDIFFPFFRENESLIKIIFNDAWEIAQDHHDLVSNLLGEIESQTDQWKSDIDSIVKLYHSQHPLPEDYGAKQRFYDRHFQSMLTPAFFVLWNEKGILFNYADDQFLEESFDGANIIPNPVVNFVDVQAVLKTPTTVEIKLFNRNGMLLESYENYYPRPGPINKRFDLTFYPSATYLLRVTTKTDSQSFLFNKK